MGQAWESIQGCKDQMMHKAPAVPQIGTHCTPYHSGHLRKYWVGGSVNLGPETGLTTTSCHLHWLMEGNVVSSKLLTVDSMSLVWNLLLLASDPVSLFTCPSCPSIRDGGEEEDRRVGVSGTAGRVLGCTLLLLPPGKSGLSRTKCCLQAPP